jgi:hypothetical protein
MSEPLPEYGGCLWPVDPACLTDDWLGLDQEVRDRALALASETLKRLTGYRVGGCPITVRPCQRGGCWDTFIPGGPFTPVNWAGRWSNCHCGGNCATNCEVKLPPPVGEIVEVKVDGAVVNVADYAIQSNVLVYTGGGDCAFPRIQDLSLPDTEVGTFSVTYLNAYPVDANGAYAAGVLAVEFAKACTTGKCKLPPEVVEVVRNGVSFSITPGSFPGGYTGLRAVDTYIALWNPEGRSQPVRVWSPDSGMRSVR